MKEIVISNPDSRAFEFGSMTLWIDKCPHLSQAEVWLELKTDSIDAAARELVVPGVTRRDDIETLPDSMKAFWIKSPSGIIHLVSESER
jgi:hypothetical protein